VYFHHTCQSSAPSTCSEAVGMYSPIHVDSAHPVIHLGKDVNHFRGLTDLEWRGIVKIRVGPGGKQLLLEIEIVSSFNLGPLCPSGGLVYSIAECCSGGLLVKTEEGTPPASSSKHQQQYALCPGHSRSVRPRKWFTSFPRWITGCAESTMDGRVHPDGYPSTWMGHSIGKL